MTRAAAALIALLAASPAAAGCQSVPDLVTTLRAQLPATAFVGEVSPSSRAVVLAWLESEGIPHEVDRIVQVAGDRGLALVLVRGETACDGTTLVTLTGERAAALIATVRRYQDLSGRGKEREA